MSRLERLRSITLPIEQSYKIRKNVVYTYKPVPTVAETKTRRSIGAIQRRRGVIVNLVIPQEEEDVAYGLPVLSNEEIRRRLSEFGNKVRELHTADPAKTSREIAQELTKILGRRINASAVSNVLNPNDTKDPPELSTEVNLEGEVIQAQILTLNEQGVKISFRTIEKILGISLNMARKYITDLRMRGLLVDSSATGEEDTLQRRSIKDEQGKWLHTLTRSVISSGKAIRYLRAVTGLDQQDFARQARLAKDNLNQIEKDVLVPRYSTLRQIFSVLELTPQDILAQLLYIKTYRNEPMTVEEVMSCHTGDLLKYVRICNGLTLEELAKKAKIGKKTIADLENGKRQMTMRHVSAIMTGLEFSHQDSLFSVFVTKVNNQQVVIGDVRKLIYGSVLVIDTSEKRKQSISEEDSNRLKKVKKAKKIGVAIAILRQHGNLTQKQLAEKAGIAEAFLWRIEKGAVASEITILAIMGALQIDIHSRVAGYVFGLDN